MNMTTTEKHWANLPEGYSLLQFSGTVQIIHQTTDYNRRIVAEVPIPYDQQTKEWWIEYLHTALKNANKQ